MSYHDIAILLAVISSFGFFVSSISYKNCGNEKYKRQGLCFLLSVCVGLGAFCHSSFLYVPHGYIGFDEHLGGQNNLKGEFVANPKVYYLGYGNSYKRVQIEFKNIRLKFEEEKGSSLLTKDRVHFNTDLLVTVSCSPKKAFEIYKSSSNPRAFVREELEESLRNTVKWFVFNPNKITDKELEEVLICSKLQNDIDLLQYYYYSSRSYYSRSYRAEAMSYRKIAKLLKQRNKCREIITKYSVPSIDESREFFGEKLKDLFNKGESVNDDRGDTIVKDMEINSLKVIRLEKAKFKSL